MNQKNDFVCRYCGEKLPVVENIFDKKENRYKVKLKPCENMKCQAFLQSSKIEFKIIPSKKEEN